MKKVPPRISTISTISITPHHASRLFQRVIPRETTKLKMHLTLAIELLSQDKATFRQHYATLFVQQAPTQAYICENLHHHNHGQLTEEEKYDYIEQLHCKGFKQVDRQGLQFARPKLYYIILDAHEDWNIDEIKVLNNFHLHPQLMNLVDELNMYELAHHLLIQEWETTKHWVNGRENFQISHGYNHLDQTDGKSYPGLYVPRRHTKPQNMSGVSNEDSNLEDTLIRKQAINTKILDWMTTYFQLQTSFPQTERKALFLNKYLVGMGKTIGDIRCEGGTFVASGPLMSRTPKGVSTAICSWHVDTNNESVKNDEIGGSNKNFCFNQMLLMPYPNRRHPVWIRVGLNQYDKKCVGDVFDKLGATTKFLALAAQYMETISPQLQDFSNINWVTKQNQAWAIAQNEGVDYATLEADPNKDCYYSWHVHVIFTEVLPIFGWNEYILVEVLFCLTLTPSSIGWRQGLRYAIRSRGNGKNLVTNFVLNMVFKHDATAFQFGKKSRHQVSSRGLLSMHDMCISCYNLLSLIRYANTQTSSSSQLYEDMSSSPRKHKGGHIGGVFGASTLTCHSIVQIATLIGLITRVDHSRHVIIPTGTMTEKRLKVLGIEKPRHRQQLLQSVCERFDINDQNIGENIICETCRLYFGESRTSLGVDTLATNQNLYQLHEEHELCVTCPDGQRHRRSRHHAKEHFSQPHTFVYSPIHMWWNIYVDKAIDTLGQDYDLVLTKESKVVKSFIERHAYS